MTFTKAGNKKAITLKKATVRTASLLLAGVFYLEPDLFRLIN